MFTVLEMWANPDSVRERVVAVYDTEQQARADADARKSQQAMPWCAYVVRTA